MQSVRWHTKDRCLRQPRSKYLRPAGSVTALQSTVRDSPQVKTAGAKESQESDDDELNCDNIVQQLGHDENENAGD
jgi:hypothetical protein